MPIIQPSKSPIGPPAPAATSWLARACMLVLLAVIGHWVDAYLGGVSVHPSPTDDSGANDTNKLFNWHPILMTLAFGVFMAEAVLTYQAPLAGPGLARPARKKVHATLHALALLCALLGALAAFKSHSLKLPTPFPDLYSPHSFLGLLVLIMLGLQFVVGAGSYLWPMISLPSRLALGPLHRFSGMLVWVAGLAAMATGIQEKSTFLQAYAPLSGQQLFGPILRLPGTAQLLLVLLGALVLYHQVPAARAMEEDRDARQTLLSDPRSSFENIDA